MVVMPVHSGVIFATHHFNQFIPFQQDQPFQRNIWTYPQEVLLLQSIICHYQYRRLSDRLAIEDRKNER
jgi:hypothetical protein